jgi:[acyl-carrier-protein] S-malonyltransferase
MQPFPNQSAFLFPGQGVLPRDVCEYYSFLKSKNANQTEEFIRIFQNALNEVNPQAKFNAMEILANETSSMWSQTAFVQPLTYTLSILTNNLFQNKKTVCTPSYMLGHSLGAFSALTGAGALTFEQGIKIVTARGKFMQEESEKTNTGMCVILGLKQESINEICQKTGAVIALLNAPTAFTLGSSRDIFPKIEQEAAQLGARKTIRLETSGAFHTKAMQGAYEKFKEFFSTIALQKPQTPVVTNVSGVSSVDPEELKNDVIESIINPVNWMRMINFLKSNTVISYIEIGPGTSLSSLCRINDIPREQILHAKTIIEQA